MTSSMSLRPVTQQRGGASTQMTQMTLPESGPQPAGKFQTSSNFTLLSPSY